MAEQAPAATASSKKQEFPDQIYLISYPKVVFMYPTFLAAVVAAIYMTVSGDAPGVDRHDTEILGTIFLMIFGVNLVVLAFDFPRTTALTLFFLIAAVVLGLLLLFRINDNILPAVSEFLAAFRPWSNSHFYYAIAAIFGVIYAVVAIAVQFDYWEVRPNELLHHHGLLSDLKRYSAPNLQIDKEINDLFEYVLLRAGRLILHPSQERRAIVLENVFFINRKEEQITRMLGALQVQVRTED